MILPDGTPVESLDVDGKLLVSFEEGEVREIQLGGDLTALQGEPRTFEVPGSVAEEQVRGASGLVAARVLRRSLALTGTLAVRAEPVADLPLFRLRIRVENRTPWEDLPGPARGGDAGLDGRRRTSWPRSPGAASCP